MVEFWIGLLAVPGGELYAPGYERQKVTMWPSRAAQGLTNYSPVTWVTPLGGEAWGSVVGAAFYWTADADEPFDALLFPFTHHIRSGDKLSFLSGDVGWR